MTGWNFKEWYDNIWMKKHENPYENHNNLCDAIHSRGNYKSFLNSKYSKPKYDSNRQAIDALKKRLVDDINNKIKENEPSKKPQETDQDKVARILKGDFEKQFGITFEKFIEVYHDIVENNPEKLI